MTQSRQHSLKPSSDVAAPATSVSPLQRRPFPHEVESKDDQLATSAPISQDWQAQQEKVARARFDPNRISLYPLDPVKEENKEKPIQKQQESPEVDEQQEQPIQKQVETKPEPEQEKENAVQKKSESGAEQDEESEQPIQRKAESPETEEPEKQEEPSSSRAVQPKLSVGKPGDRYEQEADQVAAKVMRMPDPSQNRMQRNSEQPESEIQPKPMAITPYVQRQSTDEEVQPKAAQNKHTHLKPDLEARLASSKAGGSPLPDSVRSFMEPRLGVSLKHVQVHTDTDAAQMNKELRAQAFAYRNHIYYAAGKSPAKDELTAHELTHVIQQTGAKQLNEGTVRRSPDETASVQPKSLESHAPATEDKRTSAETSIQRHTISRISPQIQGDWLTDARERAGDVGSAVRGGAAVVGDVATGDPEGAKRRLRDSISGFASGIPGYSLLSVILGKDPIKDKPVARNATNVVKGILELVPGGDRLFNNLQESGALQKAFAWFEKELKRLNLTWNNIKGIFRRAFSALSPTSIFNPGGTIERIANLFRDPIRRITRFARAVGEKVMEFVFEGAMAMAGKGGASRVMGILKKVGGLFKKIVKDPIGFVGNLVRSVKGGFENFSGNIMKHLKAGLMGWLFGALSGAGLQMPAAFNLKGMLSIALQVVGTTYQKLRKRLVKRMGEKKVSQTEKSFALLRSIAAGGLIAAWKEISQSTGDVKEMVISEVRNWVITTIIKKAVIKLVSMFNPAGAVVQAVIAVYNTVMFFIERMQQIIELAQAVFNSINSIAAGKIKAAIKFIEQSMAKSLPVIISFMARLLGLGGISKKIRNIIKRMQKLIDRAMNRIIDTVMKFARKLTKNKDKNSNQKNTVSPEEKEKHKIISQKIYKEMKTKDGFSKGLEHYFSNKVKQSKKLEKHYSKQIRKGIKLSINLKEIVQGAKQGFNLVVSIKPNDVLDDYQVLHRQGELEDDDYFIERAIEGISREFYKPNSMTRGSPDLRVGIQKIISEIQGKYNSACVGRSNIFSLAGHQFFVDRGGNNYVYPLSKAQAAGIQGMTTKRRITGYEYSKPAWKPITIEVLKNMIIALGNGIPVNVDEVTMLIASLAAEPFRYRAAHITNLIALNNQKYMRSESQEDQLRRGTPAFDVLSMTTGGSDPSSDGSLKEEVRRKQVAIVKDDDGLNEELSNYYEMHKGRKNAKKMILSYFVKTIRNHLEKIR